MVQVHFASEVESAVEEVESESKQVMDESMESVDDNVVIEKTDMEIVDKTVEDTSDSLKVAEINESVESIVAIKPEGGYSVEQYNSATVPVMLLSSTDYALKISSRLIVDHAQKIIDVEAPISYDRLVKKILRSFDISRSSVQTIEATEKALKKTVSKSNKQNGVKFYWREDQNPDAYGVYRVDTDIDDKRGVDDVCQQELKNAVCKTLQDKGALAKDELVKETIRTMGFSRSGAALVDAVERGIKYGRKTGEIIIDEDKRFLLG